MFGMGFMEIFLILIIGIIALGPEKLPGALVDAARFFKKFKSGIDEAKSTLDNELNISEMKKQASDLKASVDDVANLGKIDIENLTSDDIEPKKPKTKETKIEQAASSKKEKITINNTEEA